MKKKINILRAGGGTWGHTFPIKSMIQYLDKYHKEQVWDHFWAGSRRSLEEKTVSDLQKQMKNLTFLPLLSGKWRREKGLEAFLKNIGDLFKFTIGILQSLVYLLRFRIDVVFCKGGYVALPVVVAAWILRKKILVHESDTRAWLVNRIASKFSSHNFVAFPEVLKDWIIVGQILSEDLIPEKKLVKKTQNTQVLVMWGSQWAKTIYESLLTLLNNEEKLRQLNFVVVLWQLNQDLKAQFLSFQNVEVKDFCTQKEIGMLYETSDLVITRAGTTSLAEQDLFWIKMIMIPIPWTHDQKNNALWYVKQKKWILIDQEDPDFMEKLKTILIENIDWHKDLKIVDHLWIISQGKEKISKILLELK